MTDRKTESTDAFEGDEAPAGPARYLRPGEELLAYSPGVQIKKFRFDAYLTDTRLFLTDPGESAGGVTAKEIPRESIVDCYIEHSPMQEPILVLSVRTSEDEVRTMKMTFVHTGKDRVTEAEEWMHLVKHSRPHIPGDTHTQERASSPLSAEARALSETVVFPPPRQQEVPRAPAGITTPRDARAREKDVPGSRPSPPPPPPQRTDVSPTQIQFCYHCGHRIPPVANYCPYCGTRMVHVQDQPAPAPSRIEHGQMDTAPQDSKTRKRSIWDIFRRLRRGS